MRECFIFNAYTNTKDSSPSGSMVLTTFAMVYPNYKQPILPETNWQKLSSVALNTHTITWSKHQSFIEDDAQMQPYSKTNTRKSILESTIIGQNISYIAAPPNQHNITTITPMSVCPPTPRPHTTLIENAFSRWK